MNSNQRNFFSLVAVLFVVSFAFAQMERTAKPEILPDRKNIDQLLSAQSISNERIIALGLNLQRQKSQAPSDGTSELQIDLVPPFKIDQSDKPKTESSTVVAAGPGVGSGGLICNLKLEGELRFLTQNLKDFRLFKEETYSQIRNRVNELISQISFVSRSDLTLNLNPRDAVNYPFERVIVFDKDFCTKATKFDPILLQSFLLHEVVRKLGLNDGPRYAISSEYYRQFTEMVRLGQLVGSVMHQGPNEVKFDRVISYVEKEFDDIVAGEFMMKASLESNGEYGHHAQSCLEFYGQTESYRNCLKEHLNLSNPQNLSLEKMNSVIIDSCQRIDTELKSKIKCVQKYAESVSPLIQNIYDTCTKGRNESSTWNCFLRLLKK
jgi:hypothetical protein